LANAGIAGSIQRDLTKDYQPHSNYKNIKDLLKEKKRGGSTTKSVDYGGDPEQNLPKSTRFSRRSQS